MKIKELPSEVQSALRTGLTITDMAQCISELVQNSLDAKSTSIAVRIDLQSFTIQVVDNGHGLNKDELNLVGTRYMTSKCHSLKEFKTNLKYYGFRGEAIASLRESSGVLMIISKHKGSNQTYTKVFRANKESRTPTISAHNRLCVGTTIVVKDFLFNLPVRKARIQPAIEIESVRQTLQALSIINHKVSFTLRNDTTKAVILQTHEYKDSGDALKHHCNLKEDLCLIPVSVEIPPFKISAFVSRKPEQSSNFQFIYVNKRLVKNKDMYKTVSKRLSKSFYLRNIEKELKITKDKPKEKFSAVYVINIQCPHIEYDIVCGPKKQEVQFRKWDIVTKCLDEIVDKFVSTESSLNTATTLSPVEVTSLTMLENTNILDDQLIKSKVLYGGRVKRLTTEIIKDNSVIHSGISETTPAEMNFEHADSLNQKKECADKEKNNSKLLTSVETVLHVIPQDEPFRNKNCKLISKSRSKLDPSNGSDSASKSDLENPFPFKVSTQRAYLLKRQLLSEHDVTKSDLENPFPFKVPNRRPYLPKRKLLSEHIVTESESDFTPAKQKCTWDSTVSQVIVNNERSIAHSKRSLLPITSQEFFSNAVSNMSLTRNILFSYQDDFADKTPNQALQIDLYRSIKEVCKDNSLRFTQKNTVKYLDCDKGFYFNCSEGTHSSLPMTNKLKDFPKRASRVKISSQNKKTLTDVGEQITTSVRISPNRNDNKLVKKIKFTHPNDLLFKRTSNLKRKQNFITATLKKKTAKSYKPLHIVKTKQHAIKPKPDSEINTFNDDIRLKRTHTQQIHYKKPNKKSDKHSFNHGKKYSQPFSNALQFNPKKCKMSCIKNNPNDFESSTVKISSIKTNNRFVSSPIWGQPKTTTDSLLKKITSPFMGETAIFECDSNALQEKINCNSFLDNEIPLVKNCVTLINEKEHDNKFLPFTGNKHIHNELEKKNNYVYPETTNKDWMNNSTNSRKHTSMITHSFVDWHEDPLVKCEGPMEREHSENTYPKENNCFYDNESVNSLLVADCNNTTKSYNNKSLKDAVIIVDLAKCVNEILIDNVIENLQDPLQFQNVPSQTHLDGCHENSKTSEKCDDGDVLYVDNSFSTIHASHREVKSRKTEKQSCATLEDDLIVSCGKTEKCVDELCTAKVYDVLNPNQLATCSSSNNSSLQVVYDCENENSREEPIDNLLNLQAINIVNENENQREEPIDSSVNLQAIKSVKLNGDVRCPEGNTQSPFSNKKELCIIKKPQLEKGLSSDHKTGVITRFEEKICENLNLPFYNPEYEVNSPKEKLDNYSPNTQGTISIWNKEIIPSGKTIYINPMTGMSSFIKPTVNSKTAYTLNNRHWFMPRGTSPLLQINTNCNKNIKQLTNVEKDSVQNIIMSNNLTDLSTIKWKGNPTQGTEKITEILMKSDSNKGWCSTLDSIKPCVFSKESLSTAKVLGQLDCKFIAALLQPTGETNMFLVLFDQHAVDERIRVENLTAGYRHSNGQLVSQSLNPWVEVKLSENERAMITDLLPKMSKLGMKLIIDENKILATEIPSCLFNRTVRENHDGLLGNMVTTFIKQLLVSMEDFRGAMPTLPHFLSDIINSEACRGAIKFGDDLTLEKCSLLISKLAFCDLPFQCAHGRPVLTPLIEIKEPAFVEEPINLKRLICKQHSTQACEVIYS